MNGDEPGLFAEAAGGLAPLCRSSSGNVAPEEEGLVPRAELLVPFGDALVESVDSVVASSDPTGSSSDHLVARSVVLCTSAEDLGEPPELFGRSSHGTASLSHGVGERADGLAKPFVDACRHASVVGARVQVIGARAERLLATSGVDGSQFPSTVTRNGDLGAPKNRLAPLPESLRANDGVVGMHDEDLVGGRTIAARVTRRACAATKRCKSWPP